MVDPRLIIVKCTNEYQFGFLFVWECNGCKKRWCGYFQDIERALYHISKVDCVTFIIGSLFHNCKKCSCVNNDIKDVYPDKWFNDGGYTADCYQEAGG